MIEQTALQVSRMDAVVGLLSTLGTLDCKVYDRYISSLVTPDRDVAEAVHNAVYNPVYGIKATASVSEAARSAVCNAVMHLKSKGCTAVILGCTELPLVFNGERDFNGVVLVDPSEILAIELIRATEPGKLLV